MAAGMSIGLILKVIYYALMAYSVISAVTAKKAKMDKSEDAGVLVNTKTTEAVLPLVYGKSRVGGNEIFATTTGDDKQYLHMIVTLSEGPVNQIANIIGRNNIPGSDYYGKDYDCDGVYLNGAPYVHTEYKDHFTYEFFNGASDQAVCSSLKDIYPNWTDTLRYTSYLYCKFKYNRDEPLSIPTITVLLEGMMVKDFSTEDNYDDMPWIYTNNIGNCVYDLLTRPSVRGGKGLDPTRIDLDSFRAAATYYTSKGWTGNLLTNKEQSIQRNIELMLVNGRSDIIYSNNKFCLKFRDTREEDVCFQITKDNTISNNKFSTLKVKPAATLFDRPNAIKATFYSADKNYTKDEKVYVDNTAYDTEGDYRELAIDLLGLSSLDKVIPMSYYYLERARWGNTVTMTVGGEGMALEPMDLVEITATMPGWSDGSKPKYRVESSVLQPDGNVALTMLQEHDNLYNDDYDIDTQELFYTDLLSPSAAVLGVRNVEVSEEVFFYREKSFTRLLIDFDPPPVEEYPFWDYAEVWLQITTSGVEEDWKHMNNAKSDYMLEPVQEGITYRIKLRSVSIYNVKEEFRLAYSISRKIIGKTSPPTDMTFLTVSSVNDAIFIYGEEIEGPDIVGYEFRIAAQSISNWEGAVYLGFNRKPNWSLSGIRAGSYRIFCCAINDGGRYSDNAVHADFKVQDPKGYTVYETKDFDYPDGSHSNTEYEEISINDWCIRVNHTGGLEGTWTSPVYDALETRTLRVQGDFILKVTDESATWDALWPTPATWGSLDIDKSWFQLYGTNKASKIEATIKWGVSDVSENSMDKFELMSVDTVGRYYQVVVKLTDPNHSQYVYLNGSGADTVLTLIFMR